MFLPIWGITKGLLKESAETLKKAKNITRTQTHKISVNLFDNTSSPTHGVPNCKIRSLFRPTWKKKIKLENSQFPRLLYKGNTAKICKTGVRNAPFLDLMFFFHVGRNNDLILQFGTPWVGEEVLSNRFADILCV